MNVLKNLDILGSRRTPREKFNYSDIMESFQGKPDFLLVRGGEIPLMAIEVKTKWVLPATDNLIQHYNDNEQNYREDLSNRTPSPLHLLKQI